MATPNDALREYVTASLEDALHQEFTPDQVSLLVHMFNNCVQVAENKAYELIERHPVDDGTWVVSDD